MKRTHSRTAAMPNKGWQTPGQRVEHPSPSLPELDGDSWNSKDQEASSASFGQMARTLPGLVIQAVRWAFVANPKDAIATMALTIAAGVFTAVGLFATTSVLTPRGRYGSADARRRTTGRPRCRSGPYWGICPRPADAG